MVRNHLSILEVAYPKVVIEFFIQEFILAARNWPIEVPLAPVTAWGMATPFRCPAVPTWATFWVQFSTALVHFFVMTRFSSVASSGNCCMA